MQEIETSCQELKINQGVAYIYLDIDCASISDGCHVMLGNALAKWIACCPVPEDISRATRALSDVTLLCNTARIGSLFLSAAAAFSILHIRRQVPGNKSNTWRAIEQQPEEPTKTNQTFKSCKVRRSETLPKLCKCPKQTHAFRWWQAAHARSHEMQMLA